MLVLAGIAIPNFVKSRQRTLQKEGYANIKVIAAAEQVVRMEQGSYVNCVCSDAATCAGATGCNTLLKLKLHIRNWVYTVTNANATNLTISAGGPGGCTYLITQNNLNGEPAPGAKCI